MSSVAMATSASLRSFSKVVDSARQMEGAGFPVIRPFPGRQITDEEADPFLLLDFISTYVSPGMAKGAPWHPHRGFQTVSYMLEGGGEHKDSMGNHGILPPGSSQWMNAGSGVIHHEVPLEDFKAKGGQVTAFQLWVNNAAKDKMCDPTYQDVLPEQIPTYKGQGFEVKIVAGSAFGLSSPTETGGVTYLDFHVDSGTSIVHETVGDHNGFVFVYKGEGVFGAKEQVIRETQCGLLAHDGVTLSASCEGECHFLLVTGKPLNEPIARRGPFVMNTMEEIYEAYQDYQAGTLVKSKGTFTLRDDL
eukprot:TRINITY_DN378_c0_g1_i1.p1 TRINITY_DN378_c0_g1~~TRINITY_DN378_c0_g1_i1.p1  ORF type:complete len:304 (-),score=53.31 TRINITY_DN378_c0_g1_i1:93-1004(-)